MPGAIGKRDVRAPRIAKAEVVRCIGPDVERIAGTALGKNLAIAVRWPCGIHPAFDSEVASDGDDSRGHVHPIVRAIEGQGVSGPALARRQRRRQEAESDMNGVGPQDSFGKGSFHLVTGFGLSDALRCSLYKNREQMSMKDPYG